MLAVPYDVIVTVACVAKTLGDEFIAMAVIS